MIGRLARLIGVITLMAFSAASTAHAADEIGLSNDGVTWSSSLPKPLFDPDFRWVPGDSETASFYVRNQGPSGAMMTIEARSADSDKLMSNDDIAMKARVDGGDWVALANGIPTASLTSRGIRRGENVRVDVNAVFISSSPNRSQTKELDINFRVHLQDWVAANGGTGSGGTGGNGNGNGSGVTGALPDTGAQIAAWMLGAGVILTVLGSLVVARRDRDEVSDRG